MALLKLVLDCWYSQSLLLANGFCFLLLCPSLTHFQFSSFPGLFYLTHPSTSKIILFLCLFRTFCCHHPGLSTLQTCSPDSTDLNLPTCFSSVCSCAFSFFCQGSRTGPCVPVTHLRHHQELSLCWAHQNRAGPASTRVPNKQLSEGLWGGESFQRGICRFCLLPLSLTWKYEATGNIKEAKINSFVYLAHLWCRTPWKTALRDKIF